MSKDFLYPSLVTILSLLLYWGFVLMVGSARGKYKVPAPQTSGNPDFERVMRVQQNTAEQLLIFVPALWIFCTVLSATWGSAVGGIWILGRIVYAVGYSKAANKRGPGFAITALASLGLVLGSLVGIVLALIRAS
jgi:glutathione S-transferase